MKEASSEIVLFPDPILRTKAQTVVQFDEKLKKSLYLMIKAMKSQKHGIGIAAPQVGLGLRMAYIDLSGRLSQGKAMELINPEIVGLEGETISREGCMSLPDYRGDLKRYQSIELVWQDIQGKRHQSKFEGIEAICIQHEVDHLEGLLFIDRISSLKRDLIPRGK